MPEPRILRGGGVVGWAWHGVSQSAFSSDNLGFEWRVSRLPIGQLFFLFCLFRGFWMILIGCWTDPFLWLIGWLCVPAAGLCRISFTYLTFFIPVSVTMTTERSKNGANNIVSYEFLVIRRSCDYSWLNAYRYVLFSSMVMVRIRVRIRFNVWLVRLVVTRTNVFVGLLLSVVIVTPP